jgi:hypothetical protein
MNVESVIPSFAAVSRAISYSFGVSFAATSSLRIGLDMKGTIDEGHTFVKSAT